MSEVTRAELRRLLAEAETPWTIEQTMTLTIGSLFTGAGMLDRAVEEVFDARTAWVSEICQYAPAIARQEQAFGYPAPSPTEPGKNGKPRLSAAFASWMMGAPPGWITDTPGVTRNEALRMAGNGVVRQQAIAALLDMRAAFRQEQAA